jgi:hypothetical protein
MLMCRFSWDKKIGMKFMTEENAKFVMLASHHVLRSEWG